MTDDIDPVDDSPPLTDLPDDVRDGDPSGSDDVAGEQEDDPAVGHEPMEEHP